MTTLNFSKSDPAAFLVHEKRVYFSRHIRSPGEPRTPATQLIQGIYDLNPVFARKILRNRIFTTYAPTEMCFGMVKVAAKSLSPLTSSTELEVFRDEPVDWSHLEPCEVTPAPLEPFISHSNHILSDISSANDSTHWMDLAFQLSSQVSRRPELYESDRPVGALLVSAEGKLLAAARNSNARNRTRHAEINLVQDFYRRFHSPLPAGATLYTTLKPCKMCAGAIWVCLEDPSHFKVIYGEDDPGRMARATIFDPGSHAQRRNCADQSLVFPNIQEKLLRGV